MASVLARVPVLAKNAIEASKPKLNVFMKYARVELVPPTPADIPRISQGLKNLMVSARTGRWKQLTVKEAWLNTLVAVEVACWFFIGECIGKRHLVGYKV